VRLRDGSHLSRLHVRAISPYRPRRWARRLWRLSSTRRLFAVEAAAALLVARLALRLVPFPRIARWLGTFVPAHDARISAAATGRSPRDADVAAEIAWAVSRASRHVPFRAVCLPQALAAHAMLRRRGIASVMHFGGAVAGDRGVVDAHAWLEAAGVHVTGYPVPSDIAEIACFI
jgi:hypothetical protein